MAEEVKKDEDWMQKKWRPAMGWMYMLVCMCDMVVFTVLWSILQTLQHQPITQWNPLTLQGAGLFHLAMGAVLGIAAFGRTQEKISGSAVNTTPPAPPPAAYIPVADPAPMVVVPPPVISIGGKAAPPPAPQPFL